MRNKKIAVIGAGSWGTAIAMALADTVAEVHLWARDEKHAEDIQKSRINKRYLPDARLQENIRVINSINDAVNAADVICMVIPSQVYREVFSIVFELAKENCIFVSAVKGIENGSLATMTEIMEEEGGKSSKSHTLAVLSGPSFAKEVAAKLPTAVTIGSLNAPIAEELQKLFANNYMRVYTSGDIKGLEISGAYKNVIAIACGICDGLGYGLNTRAALITRGLAEITRIGMELGADQRTFSGLSGIGDLILTCTGDLSRNRHVGLELGKGKKIEQILAEMNMVAEGVKTTKSGVMLARKHKVEMPILDQVYKILYEGKDCSKAVNDLLSRELKEE